MSKKWKILAASILVIIMALSFVTVIAEVIDEVEHEAKPSPIEEKIQAPADEQKPSPVEEKVQLPADEQKPSPVEEEIQAAEVVEDDMANHASLEAIANEQGEARANITRSVSVLINNGRPGSLKLGDKVTLEAVLQGFEGVKYDITWEYSLDNSNWVVAPGISNQLTYTYILDEENAAWLWHALVNPFEIIEDDAIPLSGGSGAKDGLIIICVALGALLLAGSITLIVIRRRKGAKAQPLA